MAFAKGPRPPVGLRSQTKLPPQQLNQTPSLPCGALRFGSGDLGLRRPQDVTVAGSPYGLETGKSLLQREGEPAS